MITANGADDLSIEFNQDRIRRQRHLTINKNVRANYQVRGMLKEDFGFAEHQIKILWFGIHIDFHKQLIHSCSNKLVEMADVRIKNDNIQWYVPQYTPSILQQDFLSRLILNNITTEI